jgi:hypothetical protein
MLSRQTCVYEGDRVRIDQLDELLALLPASDPESLADSIRQVGVRYPVLTDENGVVLDGRTRSSVAAELGVEYETRVLEGLSDKDKIMQAFTLNLNRRQVNIKQKHDIIIGLWNVTEGEAHVFSQREIATMVGMHHSAVQYVIKVKGGSGGIPPSDDADNEPEREQEEALPPVRHRRDSPTTMSEFAAQFEEAETEREAKTEAQLAHERRLADPPRYRPSEGQEKVSQAKVLGRYHAEHPMSVPKLIALTDTDEIPGWTWGKISKARAHELLAIAKFPDQVHEMMIEGKIGGNTPVMIGRLYAGVEPPIDDKTVILLAEKFALGALPTGGVKKTEDGDESLGIYDVITFVKRMHEAIAKGDSFYENLYQRWFVNMPTMSLESAIDDEKWHSLTVSETDGVPAEDAVEYFMRDLPRRVMGPLSELQTAAPGIREHDAEHAPQLISALETLVRMAEGIIETLRGDSNPEHTDDEVSEAKA